MSGPAPAGPKADRVGAFEVLLGAALLTAMGFVLDLILSTLPWFTVGAAIVAFAAGGARIWAGYRRGRQA